MQMKTQDAFAYVEYSLAVYPNAEGTVTVEQDQSRGMMGVTLAIDVTCAQVPAFVNALVTAKKALTNPDLDMEFRVGAAEIYVSKNRNICITVEGSEDPIIIEPHRIEVVVVAIQKAAEEIG
jgi:hypothetical protein